MYVFTYVVRTYEVRTSCAYRPSLAPREGAHGGGEGVPRLVAKVRTAVKKVPAFSGVLRDAGGADDGRRGTPDAGRNPLTPLDS